MASSGPPTRALSSKLNPWSHRHETLVPSCVRRDNQPLRRTRKSRHRAGACGPFTHAGRKVQPRAEKVWGVDLPLEIPAELIDSGLACVRWCNAQWWKTPTDYARANYRLGLWLLDLVETRGQGIGPGVDWVDSLRVYCRKNMMHGVSVDELAKVAGLERHQLRRRLLTETDMTPRQFLDDIRAQHACSLLRCTAFPIAKVGDLCGYSSPAVFCRAFRRVTGNNPRKWRQESLVLSF